MLTLFFDCCTGCQGRTDVTFIIDNSVSVDPSSFELVKTFLKYLVTNLDIDNDRVRVSMVTYAASVLPRFTLTQYRTRLAMTAAISTLQYSMSGGPNTNTAAALSYVRQVPAAPPIRLLHGTVSIVFYSVM